MGYKRYVYNTTKNLANLCVTFSPVIAQIVIATTAFEAAQQMEIETKFFKKRICDFLDKLVDL